MKGRAERYARGNNIERQRLLEAREDILGYGRGKILPGRVAFTCRRM
jgi:hypothetical protein